MTKLTVPVGAPCVWQVIAVIMRYEERKKNKCLDVCAVRAKPRMSQCDTVRELKAPLHM